MKGNKIIKVTTFHRLQPNIKKWDQNMLLIGPLVSRSGCDQNESLPHQVPDTFQQLQEIKTGVLS